MLPDSMKALVTIGDGTFRLHDVKVPVLGSQDVLVKVHAAAQNPTDWKTLLLHTRAGNILGCDFAGVIVDIGSQVATGGRKIGDRVAGFVHGEAIWGFAEVPGMPYEWYNSYDGVTHQTVIINRSLSKWLLGYIARSAVQLLQVGFISILSSSPLVLELFAFIAVDWPNTWPPAVSTATVFLGSSADPGEAFSGQPPAVTWRAAQKHCIDSWVAGRVVPGKFSRYKLLE
ncbi:chaperonin 10-like protein [Mycena galopus ATCC 62051]|nr:chaperonin 10-like protein [Mycena galopus ATCC 62051]